MTPDSVWSLLSELSVSQSDSHLLPDNCLAFLSYCSSALMPPRLERLLRDKKFSLLILPFLLLSLCWPSHILKGLECLCLQTGRKVCWGVFVAVSYFCLSWASIAREINGSRSSGEDWWSAGGEADEGGNTPLGSRAINLSRRRIVFAEWVALAQDGSNSCSLWIVLLASSETCWVACWPGQILQ